MIYFENFERENTRAAERIIELTSVNFVRILVSFFREEEKGTRAHVSN